MSPWLRRSNHRLHPMRRGRHRPAIDRLAVSTRDAAQPPQGAVDAPAAQKPQDKAPKAQATARSGQEGTAIRATARTEEQFWQGKDDEAAHADVACDGTGRARRPWPSAARVAALRAASVRATIARWCTSRRYAWHATARWRSRNDARTRRSESRAASRRMARNPRWTGTTPNAGPDARPDARRVTRPDARPDARSAARNQRPARRRHWPTAATGSAQPRRRTARAIRRTGAATAEVVRQGDHATIPCDQPQVIAERGGG